MYADMANPLRPPGVRVAPMDYADDSVAEAAIEVPAMVGADVLLHAVPAGDGVAMMHVVLSVEVLFEGASAGEADDAGPLVVGQRLLAQPDVRMMIVSGDFMHLPVEDGGKLCTTAGIYCAHIRCGHFDEMKFSLGEITGN